MLAGIAKIKGLNLARPQFKYLEKKELFQDKGVKTVVNSPSIETFLANMLLHATSLGLRAPNVPTLSRHDFETSRYTSR